MTGTAPEPSGERVWHIDSAHATARRMWDGELVVYDDLSGDTSKLDPLMTVIFMQLLEKPARTIDLVARLAGELGVDNDPKLHRLTEIALGRLAGSGLVQPEPGPAVRRQ